MSFDGSTIHALTFELNNELSGYKINKIAQPESEEILLTLKGNKKTKRLLISSNASLPLIYITKSNKTSPQIAPNFCMVLRKYINNGTIKQISQVDFERVIKIEIEHLNELKDISTKYIYVEIMGKHSNIIFTTSDNTIIDSIKHISCAISSVREVLPGKEYFIPSQANKISPLDINKSYLESILKKPTTCQKAIFQSFIGISPIIAAEICENASIDGEMSTSSLSNDKINDLYNSFISYISLIKNNNYEPNIIIDNGYPIEYAPIKLNCYNNKEILCFNTMSEVLEEYFKERNRATNIKQRSSDIRKIIQIHLERNAKKIDIQKKQLKDTEKMDKLKLYGELLTSYAYSIENNAKNITVNNYYTNEDITIPLDPQKNGIENANKYFTKYNKLKRTKEALIPQIKQTEETLEHLRSIESSIMLCESESDLYEIKQELIAYGFIKKNYKNNKKKSSKSKPLHYITKDGFHIYIGKNNLQNDELTFHFATGNDWWFHTKTIHGSHVIVKNPKDGELPDHIYEIAASAAAYYSSARENRKVEIDYVQKKHVKKPNQAAPGFVVYYTNYSMIASPSIKELELIQ